MVKTWGESHQLGSLFEIIDSDVLWKSRFTAKLGFYPNTKIRRKSSLPGAGESQTLRKEVKASKVCE